MTDDVTLLPELMLSAEVFCGAVEAAVMRIAQPSEREEIRLKISQCRGALAELQNCYDNDELTIADPIVRANFRYLVIGLLWAGLRAAPVLDFRTLRRLVQIEAGFTLLLTHYCAEVGGANDRGE